MSTSPIHAFIEKWRNASGGERAQSQRFLLDFCRALGLEEPMDGDYKFEFDVKGDKGRNFIDLYKRGCFVLESKQSRARRQRSDITQPDLLPPEKDEAAPKHSRASRQWDTLMTNARAQAENYARHLPPDHDWPPFIIVCDVGLCFELYADFTGKGRNYTQFPDRQSFRIFMDDLAKPEVQAMFRQIWIDPHVLDPTRRAVRATRAIAERLAAVSKRMEQRKLPAEDVAAFLMRCIFTMFAEDVELLPRDTFKSLLDRAIENPQTFAPELEMLWRAMDSGGYATAAQGQVKHFNGQLFKHAPAYPLEKEEIGELREAARQDWREVDPSIFGTLLEQALDPQDRARLGAHYTPRAYVERLVVATVIEPLRVEWVKVLSAAELHREKGEREQAIATVRRFHEALYNTHVLDPACGTGNFLYVALELMKRLEGEVVEALVNLGGSETLAGLERHEVDPHQFLGVELNARARHIAELVLWIGYLQWHMRSNGSPPKEPVLREYHNIQCKDAVLAHDGVDAKGNYLNPRRPDWPEADYIVGNPPFIGGKDIRARLGDHYAEALWAAHPQMNDSADFVMYWWDRAAELLTSKGTRLRRFGLVTTNSITQPFQRRTVERHLKARNPISLLLAIPDHPWTKATKQAAAVRIAMTVVGAGVQEGVLQEVVKDEGLDTDEPRIMFISARGKINANLTIGSDATEIMPLKSNRGLASRGVIFLGEGFIVDNRVALVLGRERREGLKNYIRDYVSGRDLTQISRGLLIVDLDGLQINEVRDKYPEVYQHLLLHVAPERQKNREAYRRENWWLFGRRNTDMRTAIEGLSRYIATVQTSKHRTFVFLDGATIPDQTLVVFGANDTFLFACLSCSVHNLWCREVGGTLEDRPRYTNSTCFDPFPFPDPDEFTRARIAALGEKLDAHRKSVQADHPHITLTQMYNVLEKLKSGAALSAAEQRLRDDGLVLILKELHEELDQAVAQAYGWPMDLPEQEVLARLVALNKARAAEEAQGHVRWLRPDYQIPRFGTPGEQSRPVQGDLGLAPASPAAAQARPSFPSGAVAQMGAVMVALATASGPLSALDIAQGFRQGRKAEAQVRACLAALARNGAIAIHAAGTRFALHRAA